MLTWRETESGQISGLAVGELLQGKTYELENVTTLLENNNEEVIEGTCGDFKNLLL